MQKEGSESLPVAKEAVPPLCNRGQVLSVLHDAALALQTCPVFLMLQLELTELLCLQQHRHWLQHFLQKSKKREMLMTLLKRKGVEG